MRRVTLSREMRAMVQFYCYLAIVGFTVFGVGAGLVGIAWLFESVLP